MALKIVAYEAKNFKRLSSLHVEPGDRALLVFAGKNTAGKTSALDGIWATLAGAKAVPGVAVKRGEESGMTQLDLGEFRVTRRYHTNGSSDLYVDRPDGKKVKSPQAMLAALFSPVAFDAAVFARLPMEQQAAMLRQLVPGLDAALGNLDNQSKEIAEERTLVNREAKQAEARLSAFPDRVSLESAPDEEQSASVLMDELQTALEQRQRNDQIRDNLKREHVTLSQSERALEVASRRIESIRSDLVKAEAELEMASTKASLARDARDRAEQAIGRLVEPDLAPIQGRINDLEYTNTLARQKRELREAEQSVCNLKSKADGLTGQLRSLDSEREAVLSAATLPLPGLAVRGDEVYFNGVPVDQASGAEQIRLGLAVGAALNPLLHVALIRDGERLDADSFEAVREWAVQNDYQVIMDKVGDAPDDGILIVNGAVAVDNGAPASGTAGKGFKTALLDHALGEPGPEPAAKLVHPSPERTREVLDKLKSPRRPRAEPSLFDTEGPKQETAAREQALRDAADLF